MPGEEIKFPSPARRLVIQISDGVWGIRQSQKIAGKTLPRSVSLPAETSGTAISGAFCELVDASGEVIYRRPMPNPNKATIEYVDDQQKLTNALVDKNDQILMVVIPDVPSATVVRFFASDERPLRVDEKGVIQSEPAAGLPIKSTQQELDDGSQ